MNELIKECYTEKGRPFQVLLLADSFPNKGKKEKGGVFK